MHRTNVKITSALFALSGFGVSGFDFSDMTTIAIFGLISCALIGDYVGTVMVFFFGGGGTRLLQMQDHHHYHHHWLDSPWWALAFLRGFAHSSCRGRPFSSSWPLIFSCLDRHHLHIAVSVFQLFLLHPVWCWIYRVSQEECARLREGVPYVKVYRYNPKHLCPKLNGYGDNGQRSLKLWQLLHTCWLPNTY